MSYYILLDFIHIYSGSNSHKIPDNPFFASTAIIETEQMAFYNYQSAYNFLIIIDIQDFFFLIFIQITKY